MNPGRFFMPSVASNIGPLMRTGHLPMRSGVGFFSKFSNSLKSFNWSGLLNGANKTLNVVNQTIPLVRQAGPMINNMKSMMRMARAFGNETNRSNFNSKNNFNVKNYNSKLNNNRNTDVNKTNNNKIITIEKEGCNYNYPNFFI